MYANILWMDGGAHGGMEFGVSLNVLSLMELRGRGLGLAVRWLLQLATRLTEV